VAKNAPQTVTFTLNSGSEFYLLTFGKNYFASDTATGDDYPYAFRAVDSIMTTNSTAPKCLEADTETGTLTSNGDGTYSGTFTLDFSDKVYFLSDASNDSKRLAVYPLNIYDANGAEISGRATTVKDANEYIGIQAIIGTTADIKGIRVKNEKESSASTFTFDVSNIQLGETITFFAGGSIAGASSATDSDNYQLKVTAVDVPTTVDNTTEHHYEFRVEKQTA
jgi:hypothetical protein